MKLRSKFALLLVVCIAGALFLRIALREHPASIPAAKPVSKVERPKRSSKAVHRPRSQQRQLSASSRKFDLAKAPKTLQKPLDLHADFAEREREMRALSTRPLTPPERQSLLDFLLEMHEEDSAESGRAFKNLVMDSLCGQPLQSLTKVIEGLIDLFENGDQDIVIRDYALQHIGQIYESYGSNAPGLDAEQFRRIEDILWAAVEETDSSLAGTALLSLSRSVQAHPGLDQARLTEVVQKLAIDASITVLTRVTALQICAQLNTQGSTAEIVHVAESDPDTSVRISAIAALGALGGRGELETLRRISKQNDPRLGAAVVVAMHRVETRLSD
jgi:hypothetical protein